MTAKKIRNSTDLCKAFRKKSFQPLYFVYGEEPFLTDEVQQTLIDNALLPHEQDFNYSLIYGADTDAGAVITLCQSLPMMAERRVVVVRNFDDLKDNKLFVAYAKKPNEMAVVLLICQNKPKMNRNPYAALKRLAVSCECKPLKERQVPEWIKQRVKSQGHTIEHQAAYSLVSYTGTRLSVVANEVDKLITYIGTRSTIETADVIRAAGQTREINVFELQTAIIQGRLPDAQRISDRLLSEGANKKGEALKMIAILGGYFTRLWKLYGCKDERLADKEVAHRTGIPHYFLRDYRKALHRQSRASLERAFSALLAADYELKGGSQRSARLVMTLLIQRLIRT